MGDHKLHLRFPDGSEFIGEGTEQSVKEAFALFLEARKTTAPKQEEPKPPDPAIPSPNAAGKVALSTIAPELMNRVYLVQGDNVSLRVKPSGAGDALLLLIYGFCVIKEQVGVTAARLAIGARQSGIKIERIDRVIAPHDQYVTKAGAKKGTTYGLNNPGIRYAEELLTKLLG
jgi:hypothetical protein